jgi:hypothetical protein
MSRDRIGRALLSVSLVAVLSTPALADVFTFSTGTPDGKIATLSRPDGPGVLETETGDDFITTAQTTLNSATFTGLIPTGTPLSSIAAVTVELYRVFPLDSGPFSGNVTTRVNSPSDVEFLSRDSASATLNFTATLLSPSFTAANSVVNGIHPLPSEFTGGEGAVTGQEVEISVNFTTPITIPADHYFFVPQVQLTDGNFLWLSAPRPIVAPGTPFLPDLQTWIRNEALDPDWLRVGTDITGQGPFNAAFTLTGTAIPEPSQWLLTFTGLAAVAAWRRLRTNR